MSKPIVIGQPLPFWLENTVTLYYSKNRNYFKDHASNNATYLASRLLAKKIALQNFGQNESVSFSYANSIVFCGAWNKKQIAIDIEPIPDVKNAMAISGFLSRIMAKPIGRASISKIGRIWTICEAILKLWGIGWQNGASAILKHLSWQGRSGSLSHTKGIIYWHSLPICGHWLTIAALRPVPLPEIRINKPLLIA